MAQTVFEMPAIGDLSAVILDRSDEGYFILKQDEDWVALTPDMLASLGRYITEHETS